MTQVYDENSTCCAIEPAISLFLRHVSKRCDEMEELVAKNDNLNIHKKIKKIIGTITMRRTIILLHRNGKMIIDNRERLKRRKHRKWTRHNKR